MSRPATTVERGDLERDLLAPLLGRRGVWIGSRPPASVASIDLQTRANYRAEPDFHRSCEVAWLYEREIFSLGNAWPLVLDEAVRLLGASGRLVTRTRDSVDGTLFELKSLLGRNPNLDVGLVGQEPLDDGSTVAVFDVARRQLAAYEDDRWTVGLLSNGAKEANVAGLVRDAARLLPADRVEFLIAGPEFPLETPPGASVRFLEIPDGDELPRVSSKKHEIVEAASHANVAIFHDRYRIEDDFFAGFDAFGYDFDFASVPQRYERGHYFPSYLGFEDRTYRWQRPIYDTRYGTLHDGHYVNGGLLVVKRHAATAVNFNPLLLHNEAEDVEFAFALRQRGIVPRMNVRSHAVTFGIPADYTDDMADVTDELARRRAEPGRRRRVTPTRYETAASALPRPLARAWGACPEFLRRRLRGGWAHRFAERYVPRRGGHGV